MGDSWFTIRWDADGPAVLMLDQRRLPAEAHYPRYVDVEGVARAIEDMVIRGAPAIGIAAAMGVALAVARAPAGADRDALVSGALDRLARTRPTAVNLFWALDRMRTRWASVRDESGATAALLAEAQAILEEDVAINRALGAHGAALVPDGARILTHCNAGALATGGYGTALGVIRAAVAAGKRVRVYSDETRPYLQGARLTAWELQQDGIDVTVIPDVAAAHLISRGEVDLAIVGSDRTVRNGDVANKIGTYGVALACHASTIPFYAAVPVSTLDLGLAHGGLIPIEERTPREVTHVGDRQLTPVGVGIRNPAFDVTPSRYVTAIITERGVARAPYETSLAALAQIRPVDEREKHA